jgi:hypothetical protein
VCLVSLGQVAFCSHHSLKLVSVFAGAALTFEFKITDVNVKSVAATKAIFMFFEKYN